jgi:hypothetical protein
MACSNSLGSIASESLQLEPRGRLCT